MNRLYTIIVLLFGFLLCAGVSAQAAISISALSEFDMEGAPARLAIGPDGKVYVSDTQKHRVEIYSNNGILLDFIEGIGRPIAIDVDASGQVYVGDAGTGSVMVFDAGGSFLYKLGAGDGEFIIPNGLVVTSTGDVYVSDSEAKVVKAFTSGGPITFGSGTFNKPTGIAVDETVSPARLYVIDDDDGTGSNWGRRYVRVYSLTGSLLSTITLGNLFSSTVVRPTGLRVDSSRLYVLDGLNSAITVLSKNGTLQTRLGMLGSGFGELDVPTDMEFDSAGTLFVADYNNSRVNVYGVNKDSVQSSTLMVSPSNISFTITNRDTTVNQDVTFESSVSGVDWTAVTTEPWLGISFSSGTTPDVFTVSARATDLSSGTYSGQVQITTSDGIMHIIDVKLTVDLRVSLFVTPQSLSFEYQSGAASYGTAYPEQTLLIYSSGQSVSWQATSNVDWVTLSSYLGTTPASVTVRLNSNADELPVSGFSSFDSFIQINAGNISGSPSDVNLNLVVNEAGNVSVSTNLSSSEFVLSGQQDSSGNGTSWTFQNLTPGDYSISFSYVEGYVRPPVQTFTVSSGETVSIDGTYRPVTADTGLVAVSGRTDAHAADVVNFTGGHIGTISFLPGVYTKADRLDFAAGDVDGNGLSEIAFTDGKTRIDIYTSLGVSFGELAFPDVTEIRLASADMDNDGRDDLIAGIRTGPRVEIHVYGINSTGNMVRKFLFDSLRNDGNFAVAAGDIDGDGFNEILIASNRVVKAYSPVDGTSLEFLWMQTGLETGMPSLSVDDLDSDGTAEVVVGYADSRARNSTVFVVDGTGAGLYEFEAFPTQGYTGGTYITTADINGDYRSEIIVGAGPSDTNSSIVKIFEANGTYMGITLDVLGQTSYGARVKAGRF